jgi:hypothetical protein
MRQRPDADLVRGQPEDARHTRDKRQFKRSAIGEFAHSLCRLRPVYKKKARCVSAAGSKK